MPCDEKLRKLRLFKLEKILGRPNNHHVAPKRGLVNRLLTTMHGGMKKDNGLS